MTPRWHRSTCRSDGTGGGGPSVEGERELVGVGGPAGRPRDEAETIAARHGQGPGAAWAPRPAAPCRPRQHTITAVEKPFASKAFALLVPLAYLALIVYLIIAAVSDSVADLQGGDAAALVGGIAVLVMFGAAFARSGPNFLETAADHIVDGLVFAFKAMGVVLPIAGFFFLGNGDFSGPDHEPRRGRQAAGLPVRPRRLRPGPPARQRPASPPSAS